jgi:putative glycosyltransferase
MQLSIVTTLYRSEPYVREFHRRISSTASGLTEDYEIIFVNDGSPDQSLEILKGLAQHDPRVTIVDLSRNFGHHRAIRTGLSYAKGNRVFFIDSDLEEAPELLLTFTSEMNLTGADVVYGVQAVRSGNLFRRISGSAAYGIYNVLASAQIPRNLLAVRLMSGRYVSNLLRFEERAFAQSGVWALTGFSQRAVPVTRIDKGETTYSLGRRVRVLMDMITAFSATPLLFGAFLGSAVLAACAIGIAWILGGWLCCYVYPSGWASAMISIWLLGGLAAFSLGVIGKYMAVIFLEVKKRPLTIVRARYGFPPSGTASSDVGESGHAPR